MDESKQHQAPCPTCSTPVNWNKKSTWRPFCSERCRLIDLGDWLDEKHRVPSGVGEEQSQPFDVSEE